MTSEISGGDYGAIFRSRERKIVLIAVAAALAILAFAATPALAAESGPQWTVSSVSRPTNFALGSTEDSYVVLVTNTGGAPNTEIVEKGKGSEHAVPIPVTITDELPAGVEALPGTSAEDQLANEHHSGSASFSKDCTFTGGGGVSCTYGGVVQPGDALILNIPVRVVGGAPVSVTNVVRVSGGGASSAVMETPTSVFENGAQAKAETRFGVSPGGATTALSSVQAGAHPDLTTTGAFDTVDATGANAGSVKDIVDDLPAGFAGDLVDTPVCQAQLFLRSECPIPTQVGVTTQIFEPNGQGFEARELEPVYNLAPSPGQVAKIGFNVINDFHYVGDIAVRAPGEGGAPCASSDATSCEPYGLKTTFYNVSGGSINYDGFSLTIWGIPASPVHDPLRCVPSPAGCSFGASNPGLQAPYFTNPTACTAEPLHAELQVTAWQEQEAGAAPNPPPTPMPFGPIVGCDRLLMEPSLTAEATSDAAYSATGFDVDTTIPQTYDNAQGLATSTLKQEVVVNPEGMTVNPSAGPGLAVCTEQQYAEEAAPEKTAQEKEEGKGCPSSSKLATVKVKTPSIEEEITGSAYLAESAVRGNRVEAGRNPFNSLLALYVIARAKNRGVLVKAPGKVEANPETGRLTTTFGPTPAFGPPGAEQPASEGLPPEPASLFTFAFNQGANAPLVTPPTCGDYTVTAQLTPWSNPTGAPLEPLVPPFPIDANCPAGNVPPFNPGVTSYPIHGNAGAYSPFYLKLTRNDGEQEITGFATQFPPGLTGNLSGVTQCGEGEVQRAREQTGVEAETSPACPANSEIGYSIAEAGVGSVLAQTPGKIYLGGPYDGAPFSVVSVTSAHVGPFDLGTVVIHFPLDINPETADVTIPASPADRIPRIIKGIVVHVRSVRVYVTRNNFMLNPTSCNPSALSATVLGDGSSGNTVTVNDPFQVAACSSLKFEPKFTASTSGKTSKADGASLHVALTYPTGALTNDSNIKYVKVDLPKALPSRLTTLQRACLQKEFKANPASCPPESLIGTARAVTPILPVPLEGPVYFVSNGGEAFPNLIMVLQGDGVTIRLVGDTYISPQGVTSSTFNTIPDQPVTSFELNLPEKKFSALGTNKNLCDLTGTKTIKTKIDKRVKGKLVRKNGKLVKETKKVTKTVKEPLIAPTAFVGQNGATFNQQTVVSVTGCPKAKVAKKKAAKKKKKGSKKKK